MVGATIPGVSLRSTLGYEPLAPLGRSTFQVVLTVIGCGKQVTISLSEAARLLGGCAAVTTANYL